MGGVNFPVALKKSVFRNRKKKIHMRIMLVEDNDIFRETFKEELLGRLHSTIVKEAANGEEVIQKLNGFAPQIIFMDLNLPGENGFQLTQKIKAQFPNVRIALLTSFDFPECRQAAVQYGAERYFVKDSFSWDEIEEFIKGHSA